MADRPIKIKIESVYLLLVEGEDEKRFLEAFLEKFASTDRVQVIAAGGKYNLGSNLGAIVKDPGFDEVRWLGITRDADTNAQYALESIQGALRRVNLPAPGASWAATGSEPVVVAIVFPDGINPGDLETLLLQAVEDKDPSRMGCVNAYFECLQNAGVDQPRQLSKAKIHAYLSSLAMPDLHLGEAAQARLLPLDSPVFNKFLDLLPKS